MKKFLLLLFVLILNVICFGQKLTKTNDVDNRQANINRQIAVSNFELQIKSISNAAVRNYARLKIAAWLWKSGRDETGQAEDIAVKAFEEIYERKSEIPELYFTNLQSEILALLESKSPAVAAKLSVKYELNDEDNLDTAYSLFKSKDGEKKVAEKIKSLLVNQSDLSPAMLSLITELSIRNSPEFVPILSLIVNQQTAGGRDFTPDTLFSLIDVFRNSIIPNSLRNRFYQIILEKARDSINTSSGDMEQVHNLLYAVILDISKNTPDLLSEASALLGNLTGRIDRFTKERNEIYEEIEKSADKLSAMVTAAESTENKSFQKELFRDASLLAIKKKKFKLAVELLEKSQIDENLDEEKNKWSLRWHDQFLSDVSEQSLKVDDLESSKYASDKIIDKLVRAEALRKRAVYYSEKQNITSAINTLDEALILVEKTDNNSLQIRMMLRLIPAFQKINQLQIGYLIEKTAKAVNSIQTLNIDDKPGTENYNKYITSIMIVDINLLTATNFLMKENKVQGLQLADRINRQEIKVIADLAVLTNSLK